jgi:hypothetical protein
VESTAPVYRVADMRTVWVKINLHQKYLPYLKKGMAVDIQGDDALPDATGTLTFIGPLVGRRNANGRRACDPIQSGRPMASRPLRDGSDRAEKNVPLSGSQKGGSAHGGKSVVFVPAGEGFEARVVTTGASDERSIEIISGLFRGDRYVREGAFELKATLMTDALDSHAGHGH